MPGYTHRDPARLSLRRLHELQRAVADAKPQPECGTVEGYWWHRDRKQPIDAACYTANAEYERTRRARRRNRHWNLNDLEAERLVIANRTRLQEAIHAKQAEGMWTP
jgi:hypothetical protein